MRDSQANSERCQGFHGYSFSGLQVWSVTLRMYTSNRFASMAIWGMDYCLLSLLNHTSYHLLQQCIFCLAILRNQKQSKWFKHKCRYTEPMTWPSDWMILITHGVNVIHSITHLIRSGESRNIQFINGVRKIQELLVLADQSFLVSGWNWIPMSFGLICDI